jgi:cytochrome c-type protein NapB
MTEKEMKKRIVTLLAVCAVMFTGGAIAGAVDSLRMGQDLQDNAKEPAKKKQAVVQGGIERSYKIQPPVIPHKVDKDRIDLKANTCMNCHSEKTYKQKKAPKAGESHYTDRDGKVTETVASRRYFCNQCHAPQVVAEPLVENTFQGAK